MPAKFILDYVMSYYGLDAPEYISGPEPLGRVKSQVTIVFPEMENIQFSGKIALAGYAYTSAEAHEEAAYQALLFIEANLKTTVVDFNYSQRKKIVKQQTKLTEMLSKTAESADLVKMMFGELIFAIEGQRRRFSHDPTLFFTGEMSAGQVDAYQFCASGLADADQYSINCFAESAPYFELLDKLTWKLIVAKTNLPI